MDLPDIMRERRSELGLSQGDLAKKVGVDSRQIRRYEAGETQPNITIAGAIAQALGISLDELAGRDVHRVNLTGDWWAGWQTFLDGEEVITAQEVMISQRGELAQIRATTRGITVEEGGYLWQGELRIWDNEILIGWYAAADGATRSKGTMYFVLHPHGINMRGRWVGLSYDGDIVTGWGSIARSEEEVRKLIEELKAG